jgi:hypothetical protein
MKKDFSRRQFIRQTALFAGLGMSFPALRSFAGEANGPAASAEGMSGIGPPGHFKADYHGSFAELPVGSVTPLGWIKGWLQRQVNGLTGRHLHVCRNDSAAAGGARTNMVAVRAIGIFCGWRGTAESLD